MSLCLVLYVLGLWQGRPWEDVHGGWEWRCLPLHQFPVVARIGWHFCGRGEAGHRCGRRPSALYRWYSRIPAPQLAGGGCLSTLTPVCQAGLTHVGMGCFLLDSEGGGCGWWWWCVPCAASRQLPGGPDPVLLDLGFLSC